MTNLLLTISSLSKELFMLMHEHPSLQQRLLPHYTALRKELVNIIKNDRNDKNDESICRKPD